MRALVLFMMVLPLVAAELAPYQDTVPVVHLLQSQALPRELAGTWLRVSDRTPFVLAAEQALQDLQPGTYARADQRLLTIRRADDAGAWAEALVGIPAAVNVHPSQAQTAAAAYQLLTPTTLPVLCWRLADGKTWPWVAAQADFQRLCRRRNQTAAGWAYDAVQRCYVDEQARPIGISWNAPLPPRPLQPAAEGPAQVTPGDVLAAAQPNTQLGVLALLLRDAGQPGFLDPEDLVVAVDTQPPAQVRVLQLGRILGPEPVHAYVRVAERLTPPLRPDNPIWGLSRERQLMALAGMIMLIVILLRWGRKRRARKSDTRV